jgi:hypothetical protein
METGLQWRCGTFHERGMCSSDTPFPAGPQASNLDSIDSMDSVFSWGESIMRVDARTLFFRPNLDRAARRLLDQPAPGERTS